MWFAHFECVVPGSNAARFYRYEIAPCLFGQWQFDFRWGRIGSIGRERQVCCADTDEALWDVLVGEARERFRHGYRLVAAELPGAVLDRVRISRPRSVRLTHLDSRRAEKLRQSRAILAQLDGDAERLARIDRLIERIDPDSRRARTNTRRGRRVAPLSGVTDALMPEQQPEAVALDVEEAELEARRDVLRKLAMDLLEDDPAVARGMLRSLEQPPPYASDGEKIVRLRPALGRIEGWSIDQFLYDAFQRRNDPPRPGYQYLTVGLAERLKAAGITRVADLVSADLAALCDLGVLVSAEGRALARACADYDLRICKGPLSEMSALASYRFGTN